jgi:hypothetical protein
MFNQVLEDIKEERARNAMRRKDCEKKGKFGNFNFLPFSLYINKSDAGRKEEEAAIIKWQS